MGESGQGAAALLEAVDRCVAYCQESGEPPVGFLLHKYTDISEERLEEYIAAGEEVLRRGGELEGDGLLRFRAARRWREYKTFYWLDMGRRDPKSTGFAVLNLKQPENGGFVEKEPRSGQGQIRVILDGVGGAEAMR